MNNKYNHTNVNKAENIRDINKVLLLNLKIMNMIDLLREETKNNILSS